MKKRYSELIKLQTFEERFEYAKLSGSVGSETFGMYRYLNQRFYNSSEWKPIRNQILIRDKACDLATPGYDIFYRPQVHHLNSITMEQIVNGDPAVLDPENLISVSMDTHNAIHFGAKPIALVEPVIRYKGDTIPWKKY